jgi:hypothetical protein
VRRSYAQVESPYPFYYLDPDFEGPGCKWWKLKLNPLLGIFKREELARSLLCVQYFPYHSRRFRHRGLKLPSQECGFALVRSAIAKNATIVIMRAKTIWARSVQGLKGYSHAFTLHSPQNVVVSRQNCPGFDAVVSAIRNGIDGRPKPHSAS